MDGRELNRVASYLSSSGSVIVLFGILTISVIRQIQNIKHGHRLVTGFNILYLGYSLNVKTPG